jgi:hypothetical protein
MPDLDCAARRRPVGRFVSLIGCVAAATLAGACGGSAEHQASEPATPTGLAAQLGPFLGHWGGGPTGVLDINADGTGRLTFSDTSSCPDAPRSGCGVTGTTDFALAAIESGTATGKVTATSNPAYDTVGEPVTIVQGSANGLGVVLALSMGKMQGWNFCNETSPHWCAGG